MKRFCFFCVVCLLLTHCLYAQKDDLRLKILSVEDGLSANYATVLLQDHLGFIWIGTTNGLNKYNSHDFTVYRTAIDDSETIGGNFITSLEEDREGNIWIGTFEGGLSKYDRSKNSFVRYIHRPNNPNSLSHNSVRALVVDDEDGKIWVGTQNGLDLFDPLTESFVHFRHEPENKNSLTNNLITTLTEDKDGYLWIGTQQGGLNRFDPNRNIFTYFPLDPDKPYPISDEGIRALYEDQEGILWVGTNSKGAYKLNKETNLFKKIPLGVSPLAVRSFQEDNDRNIWIGTENSGLHIFDQEEWESKVYLQNDNDPTGLKSNSISDILKDKQGNIWFTTNNAGVHLLDKESTNFHHYQKIACDSNSLGHDNVNSFYEDQKGQIWIGTDGGGISVLNRQTNTFRHFRQDSTPHSLPSDVILTIKQGADSSFWIGTFRGGLTVLKNPENAKFFTFPESQGKHLSPNSQIIAALLEEGQGNWWIGTWGGGLNYYDRKRNKFTYYKSDPTDTTSLISNSVTSILKDRKEQLWIGTVGGISLLKKGSKEFINYFHRANDPTSLSNNLVYQLFEDSKGNLWVATNNGLNKFNRDTKTFTRYFEKDGLGSNDVEAILEDAEGNLWISTSGGLSVFDPTNNTFINYTWKDGLQGNNFNRGASLKLSTGEMLFGGSNGFTLFHPDSIKVSQYNPPVFITDFQLFNKPVIVGKEGSPLETHINEAKEITLSYEQNVFSFEFTALNYSVPEESEYAYKMEGFDDDWIYAGNKNTATYTNLDPGTYTFRVKASNSHGVWNENGASLTIHIKPPFWQTWWFRTMVFFGVVGSTLALYKLRIDTIKTQTAKLERQVKERTTEVVAQKQALALQAEELHLANDELKATNEELVQSQEQIAWQRDQLTGQNQQLQEAREAIEEHNKNLDEEVKKQLKEILDYNQQLEQFAYISAHNLRAPVARILGLGQLLKIDKFSAEEKTNFTDRMVSSAEDLDQVVKDLSTILALKKNSSLTLNEVNLEEEIELVKSNLKDEIQETDTRIHIDFSEVNSIKTVKPYLDSILYNLISNAIKYRKPATTPHIDIKAENSGVFVCLRVKDNGLGIDLSKYNKKLFSLYQRFHSHVEGKGMGLYLVKTQVEAMGGMVQVESQPEEGTTFKVYLKNGLQIADTDA